MTKRLQNKNETREKRKHGGWRGDGEGSEKGGKGTGREEERNRDRMSEFGKRYSLFCIEKDWELFPRVDFLLTYIYQGLPVPYPFRETGCDGGKVKSTEGRAATDKNHLFL